MKKADDFSEWYNEIVEKANLTDKRYPIKGMNVWTPYGWKIMQAIDSHIRQGFDATYHQEVCFPLLIPEDQFAKEKAHIKGFDAEVFWVTHAGLNPLDVKLLLRPTSETADRSAPSVPAPRSAATSSCRRIGEGGSGHGVHGGAARAGATPGGSEDHQTRHGHAGGDRAFRGRAPGPGPDGPSAHRQGL
jgi:hypothetical protein